MPATLVEGPLGISCVFSDGRRGEFLLEDVANRSWRGICWWGWPS